jgi:hypothetical protein
MTAHREGTRRPRRPIIFAEEAFLAEKFGEEYAAYTGRVNCLVPSLRRFELPNRRFSFRMMLKREHDSFFGLTVSFVLIELFREYG